MYIILRGKVWAVHCCLWERTEPGKKRAEQRERQCIVNMRNALMK